MSWKDWSAVKKGALIGGVIFLILFVTLISLMQCDSMLCGMMGLIPTVLLPTSFIPYLFGFASRINAALFSIISVLIYVGIGALIGYIVQKVKSK